MFPEQTEGTGTVPCESSWQPPERQKAFFWPVLGRGDPCHTTVVLPRTAPYEKCQVSLKHTLDPAGNLTGVPWLGSSSPWMSTVRMGLMEGIPGSLISWMHMPEGPDMRDWVGGWLRPTEQVWQGEWEGYPWRQGKTKLSQIGCQRDAHTLRYWGSKGSQYKNTYCPTMPATGKSQVAVSSVFKKAGG